MKILVIEDQEEIRVLLRELLEAHGHEVMLAEDGLQGVARAADGPEFIFCDVDMPGLDGHGALVEIKKLPGVSDVPFVFLTARGDRTEQRTGMALGADDYITKPFSESDIFAAIAARTKRHGGLREQIRQLAEHRHREINAQWSHELLTPLNAVLGSLDLLESNLDAIDRQELREMLGLIREGARRQERLARKLIAYFSLEQLARSPGHQGSCSADVAVVIGASRAISGGNRERDFSISASPGEVPLADHLLIQAVAELVENAATFSAAGTPVVITGRLVAGRYRIEIADQGPGLSAEQRAQIGAFTQFERKTREQQGLGLGLAIARQTAKIAGGNLTLAAGPDGRGLLVEFDLPAVGG